MGGWLVNKGANKWGYWELLEEQAKGKGSRISGVVSEAEPSAEKTSR